MNPKLVDLGDAGAIDTAIAAFRKVLLNIEGVLPASEKGLKKTDEKLYSLVFDPLRKHLNDSTQIFISPEGNLSLLPFEVMVGPDGRYLVDEYTFCYVTTGRDIMWFNQRGKEATWAVIIANPDFDLTA